MRWRHPGGGHHRGGCYPHGIRHHPADNGTTQTPAGGSTPTQTPTGPVGPGCGTRPAGTYEVQSGDSMWAITKKFCITETQLRAANEWATGAVTFLVGQKINIPAANG